GPPDLKLVINSTSSLLTCDSTHTTLRANVSNGNSIDNYYYTWKLAGTVVAQGVGLLSYRTNVPGTYTLEIAALAGCSALVTGTYVVTRDNTPPAAPTGNNEVKFCTGSSLKSISVIQPGSGFEINWFSASTGGTLLGTGNIYLPTAAGTYYAETKKLSTGCVSARVPVMLTAVSVPVITATPKAPCLGQTNGSITTSISGGTAIYNYSWNTGQTTASLSNIGSGNFTVVVKDVNNCADTLAVVVPVPADISLSLTPTQVTCNGANNGSIAAVASGGSGTLTYLWSNNAITSTISGLAPGNYSVTVSDAIPCSASATITITQPAALSASGVETDKSCSDKNNGSIDVTVSGGKTPYTFLWSNSLGTAEDVIGLPAGTFTVTVTDANGCTIPLSKTISGPSALFAPANVTPVACFGQSTGTISITATGGNSGYTYLWADGSTGATRTNLPAGSYVLTLKDSKNCQKDTTIVVTQPTAALSLSSTKVDVGCFGASTGTVDLTVTGGTSAYTYLWSNAATTEDLTGLAAGTYTVTVTDSKGCTATLNNIVTQPQKLAVTGVITDAVCTSNARASNGGITITVTGGTTAYTYSWTGTPTYSSTGMNPTGRPAGTYSVTVTDSKSCTATWSGIIKETTPTLIPPSNIISNN
ncbi:MAG: SprB repeat-containing protein, partial [Bacteroidota bacterium]